jgi:hypothetical protein
VAPRLSAGQRELLALDRTTDEQTLRSLATDLSQSVRMAVAMSPMTPIDVLMSLLEDKHWSVSGSAVENLSADRRVWEAALALGGDLVTSVAQVAWLPLDLAEQLALHPDKNIRVKVANSTVHLDLLDRLADDPEPAVRSAVATSRRVRLDTLRKLASDRLLGVRAAVASNPGCPDDVLVGFASDRSSGVRWSVVVGHPHRPDLMALFIDDGDEMVRRHAQHQLESPAQRFVFTAGSILFRYRDDGYDDVFGPIGSTGAGTHGLEDPVAAEIFRQGAERAAKSHAMTESTD